MRLFSPRGGGALRGSGPSAPEVSGFGRGAVLELSVPQRTRCVLGEGEDDRTLCGVTLPNTLPRSRGSSVGQGSFCPCPSVCLDSYPPPEGKVARVFWRKGNPDTPQSTPSYPRGNCLWCGGARGSSAVGEAVLPTGSGGGWSSAELSVSPSSPSGMGLQGPSPMALGEEAALRGGVGVGSGGGTVSSKLECRGDMSFGCTTSALQVRGFSAVYLVAHRISSLVRNRKGSGARR